MGKNKEKNNENMSRADKGKMFLKHCCNQPMDVLRLGKATVLYGTKGLKARAGELARNEWEKQRKSDESEDVEVLLDVKFSIIMSIYNADIKLLKSTIQSIENQTYGTWELCIINSITSESDLRVYSGTLPYS